jgi:glycosyltransferase involved in cell wall biosynthesis
MNPSLASPESAAVRVLVFGRRLGDRYRAGRTIRALRSKGIVAEDVCDHPAPALAETLQAGSGPVWLVRAGAWPASRDAITFPPPSGTGRPLAAVGVIRPQESVPAPADSTANQWTALLATTGGDFTADADHPIRLPAVASVYLEPEPADQLAAMLSRNRNLGEAMAEVLAQNGLRVVRYAPLDVHHDRALRVLQVVTSLQQGGAERVALSLAHGWNEEEIRCLLVTLGRPTRRSLPVPPDAIDLSRVGGDRAQRLTALGRVVNWFVADVIHGHLLDGPDIAQTATLGVPLVVTVHNVRPGWPAGLDGLRAEDATLLVACAQAVEADLRAARVPIPVRTAWNGIDFAKLGPSPALCATAADLRRQLGFGPEDFVLLALANPRPQKRLDVLPAILACTQRAFQQHGIAREARLVIGGEASQRSGGAVQAERAIHNAVGRFGLGTSVRFLGSVSDVAPVLAAADVLVSCSAYEGLSLAHLESLAANRPVVATDAGGTAEIARDNPAVTVLPLDAPPERFAENLVGIAQTPPPDGRSRAAVHFSRARMVERYGQLYPRAIEVTRTNRRGDGLLLITNNFSTGGAQSSARRLLVGLAADGVRVRAAVLEEEAAYPTPGRRALAAAGVEVRVVPPAGTLDPAGAVTLLLEQIDADPPQTVLLWNVIPEYKLLLADALLDLPIFDVSPGEMYFTSLQRYFQRPRPGLPYRIGGDYGSRLAGVIVKYNAEADRAAQILQAPVYVIPNGVPLPPVPEPRHGGAAGWGDPRRTREGSRDPRRTRVVIGTLARIAPQKNLEDLLAALRQAGDRLPPHVLRIAGGVERGCSGYAEQLRRLSEGLAVEWIGESEDVSRFLQDIDFFALVAEPAGCPNASLEAMAHGLAVVSTDVGGAAEQVDDGVTGRLVRRSDARALAEALIELACNRDRRVAWGAAGRRRVEAYFHEQRMVADYRRVCLTSSG